jgi:hypothetical protein
LKDEPGHALLRKVQVLLPKDDPEVDHVLQEDEQEVGLQEDEQEVGLQEDEQEVDQGHVLEPADLCRSIYI